MEKKTELMALMLQRSSAWPEGRFYLLVLQPSDTGFSKKKLTPPFYYYFLFCFQLGLCVDLHLLPCLQVQSETIEPS